jgi:hypothetical protein
MVSVQWSFLAWWEFPQVDTIDQIVTSFDRGKAEETEWEHDACSEVVLLQSLLPNFTLFYYSIHST